MRTRAKAHRHDVKIPAYPTPQRGFKVSQRSRRPRQFGIGRIGVLHRRHRVMRARPILILIPPCMHACIQFARKFQERTWMILGRRNFALTPSHIHHNVYWGCSCTYSSTRDISLAICRILRKSKCRPSPKNDRCTDRTSSSSTQQMVERALSIL